MQTRDSFWSAVPIVVGMTPLLLWHGHPARAPRHGRLCHTLRCPRWRRSILGDNTSMIPPFDDSGWLPPGVHGATLAEIEDRFGRQSELRRVQMESVRWMVDLARRAGVERIVLNGSFVTDIMEPNDVDCLLLTGRGDPKDSTAAAELLAGVPFLEINAVRERGFKKLVEEFFATDRFQVPKGMVELIL